MKPFAGFSQKNSPQADLALSNIRVASPCPADWSKMISDERVRHCSECNLNVYNLSAMTEREATKLIANRTGKRLCIRIYRRADGTVLTQDCPWGWRALKRRASRMVGVALSALMSVSFAIAKSGPRAASPQAAETKADAPGIGGVVIDPQGAVIRAAKITLIDLKKNRVFTTSTDASGAFRLAPLPAGNYQLTISAQLFREFSQTFILEADKFESFNVTLPLGKRTTTVEVGMTAEDFILVETAESDVVTSFGGNMIQVPPTPRPPLPLRY